MPCTIFDNVLVIFRAVTLALHCATSQKVAGSIPDGVTGIFQ
jgi:hypothetical protein